MWALDVAKSENYANICVLSDAKICVDALNGASSDVFSEDQLFL